MSQMWQIFYSDHAELPLPMGHRFPNVKYRLLRERLSSGAFSQSMEMIPAAPATFDEIGTVHTTDYISRLRSGVLTPLEQRRIGFPWTPEMVTRSRTSAGATLAATRVAIREGLGIHLAGGTHHAYPEHGQGFCVFNDVAIAIRVSQQHGTMTRAVVIDCDVHQGNGTAAIFAADEDVFTFSMHGARNYPFARHAGDLDIDLPDQTTDQEYLVHLRDALDSQLPLDSVDVAFYIAGADVLAADRLGRLALTPAGIAHRDWFVIDACRRRGLPLVITMGGGYAPNIADTIAVQAQTVETAISWGTPTTTYRSDSPDDNFLRSASA